MDLDRSSGASLCDNAAMWPQRRSLPFLRHVGFPVAGVGERSARRLYQSRQPHSEKFVPVPSSRREG
jgi:hypothetical protein